MAVKNLFVDLDIDGSGGCDIDELVLGLRKVSGWGVYCYDFLLLPITSYYFLLLLASPARV